MSRPTLVKLSRPEASSSPELRHLVDMCITEARPLAVFTGTMESLVQQRLPDDSQSAPLLLFGDADVFLGRTSLDTMLAALDAGAEAVVAAAHHTLDDAEAAPIRTLRDFERLEGRLLAAAGEPSGVLDTSPSTASAAVALWSADAVAAMSVGSAAEYFGEDRMPRLPPTSTDRIHAAGVYFELADYYGQQRNDILDHVPPDARKILEVGCGRGLTGARLRERGAHVTGVEKNAAIAAEADARLDRVIVGDIERLQLDGAYDAIVATELLEHLVDPVEFLRRARALLEPGGRVVLSTPNIGHHAVIGDLLAGRWDYVPAGPLCVTHLRFLTRHTLETWIERAGYSRWEIRPQMSELPEAFGALSSSFPIDRDSLRTESFLAVLYR